MGGRRCAIPPAGTSPSRRSPTPAALVGGLLCASALAAGARPRRAAYASAAMTERKTHLDTLAVVALVVCCFLWGLNQVAAKVAMPEVPPLWQAALRSVGGGAAGAGSGRGAAASPLFERDGTLPGGLLAGALFARRVRLHLRRPAVHDRVAHGRLHLHRAVRRRARHAAASPAPSGCAPLQIVGPGARLRRRRLGVRRRLLAAGAPARSNGSATRSACSPACSGARPRWRSAPPRSARRSAEKTLLYQLAVSALLLLAAARAVGRAAAAAPVDAGLGVAAVPDRDRHLRQLPGLVLAGPPLPGDAARRRSRC